jgi:hypothetical protein
MILDPATTNLIMEIPLTDRDDSHEAAMRSSKVQHASSGLHTLRFDRATQAGLVSSS